MTTSRYKDLTGQKFSRLTAIKFVGKDSCNNARWLFKCDCGNEIECRGSEVSRGATKSCGCLVSENTRAANLTHGMSRQKVYKTWIAMKARCFNEDDVNFPLYGGRGITVCKEWLDFETFYKDMGDIPDGYSIERLDTNLGYSKDNCKWASATEQQRNKRNSKWWFINGVRYESHLEAAKALCKGARTIIQWCEGYVSKSGKYVPPKPNCYSELKYKETT